MGTNGPADVSAAADWISEDHNLTDSESDGDLVDSRGEAGQDRMHQTACEEMELTQAFEQRCLPRGVSARQPPSAATSPTSAGMEPKSREPALAAQGPSLGYGGPFAWAASSGEGAAQTHSNNHGGHGVLTLGSVVPAAGSPTPSGSRSHGAGEL